MVDRSFAVTTSWSISARYPIKYFNVIFDMYYFNMSVHHMKKNMYMSIQHVCNTQHVFLFFAELQVQQVEEFNRMICAIFECQHFVDSSQLHIFVFISAATVISQQLELWRSTSSWKSTQCRWPTSPWSKSQPSECQQSCLWQQSDWQHEPSSSHRLSTQHAWHHRHSTTRPTTTTWKRGGFAPQQNSTKPWRMWQQNRSRGSMGQHSCRVWQGDPQQEPNTGCNNSLLPLHWGPLHDQQWTDDAVLVHSEQGPTASAAGQQEHQLGSTGHYLMPQLQVEAVSTIKFTTDELASTQHWVLESNNDQSIMSRIATYSVMGQRILMDIQLCLPNKPRGGWQQRSLEGLATGRGVRRATCINKLPQQECQRIWTLLTDASNYQPLRQLQLAGTKTPERLRGNSQVIEWVNNTFTWEEYALRFNEYHNKMSDDEDNMMQQGEWERHQQRVELRSPWCHKASKQQSWWVQQDLAI